MNTSLIKVNEITTNSAILGFLNTLIANHTKRFFATFTKKDGSVREMKFVVNSDFNKAVGLTHKIDNTSKKMLDTKCHRDMLTVMEIVTGEVGGQISVRPRTLNLGALISLKVL